MEAYDEWSGSAAQQRELGPSAVAPSAPDQQPQSLVSGTANANESKPAVAAASRSTRSYWTNYRGPARDGRYDETAIRTTWPAEGLRLLWKQPVGGGYASFVIAEGCFHHRAATASGSRCRLRGRDRARALDSRRGCGVIESMGGDGPRATPTWKTADVCVGAQGDLRCSKQRRKAELVQNI